MNQGNPALDPEIRSTLTGGVVFQPRLLPGFAVSVEYYRIRIRDAIASQYSSLQVLDPCANSNYTNPMCGQVVRSLGPTSTAAGNFPSQVNIFQTNVASIRTSVFGGTFSSRVLATRLISYTSQASAAATPVEYAGNADFADVGNQPSTADNLFDGCYPITAIGSNPGGRGVPASGARSAGDRRPAGCTSGGRGG